MQFTGAHSITACPLLRSTPWTRGCVRVYSVFSLARDGKSKPIARRSILATEAPPADARQVRPKKAVQAITLQDRPLVELVMALATLAAGPSATLTSQLAEHELQLVTTSTTCDSMFASALDSFSEEFMAAGDGMAIPMADVRAAAERMAAEVHDSSGFVSNWNPAQNPGSSSFASASSGNGQPVQHTLEQLMAQSDYNKLLGPDRATEAGKVLRHVQALQAQIQQAAAKAAHVSQPHGSAAIAATARAKPQAGQQKQVKQQRQQADKAAATTGNTVWSAIATDADIYGDAAAMPAMPQLAGRQLVMPGLPGISNSSSNNFSNSPSKQNNLCSYPIYTDPVCQWLVADSADGKVRHIVVHAPDSLAAAVSGHRASSDLATFENYAMGAKINKRLYTEANALYNRLMPLVLDHIEEHGADAKVALSGSSLGGSLAALLLLMFVARGMRPSVLAPVYTLNAPAVLCEVPDFKQWCSKDGCSLQDMDGMLEDLLHRGILSQLGLPQDAIRNIYHQQATAEAAVQAVNPLGPFQAVAASGSKHLSNLVHHLDTAALQESPLVPDMLKAWLKAEGSAWQAGYQRLHILNPVGKMMLFVGASGSS
eukprot:GHRR01000187.1.p1 GENE.GHRR01000187.1~~GHRR01000187.1.p1  ORF type:complete len:599 (+),score=243.14 GHRR01000187.1:246-2042(+)